MGVLITSGSSAEERRKAEHEGTHGRQGTERGGKVWETEAAADPISMALPPTWTHLHTSVEGALGWLVAGEQGQGTAQCLWEGSSQIPPAE